MLSRCKNWSIFAEILICGGLCFWPPAGLELVFKRERQGASTVKSYRSSPAGWFLAHCVGTAEEIETLVNGYDSAGGFISDVHYVDNVGNAVDISQLIPLVDSSTSCIDSSTSCRQFVQWRCYGALMSGGGYRHTFWRNRHGQDMGYWGGASPVPVGRCAFSL